MELRTALYIYLPLDATADEIEAAHNIIDGQFGVNPQTIVGSNATPGPIANASALAINEAGKVTGINTGNVELDVDGLPWDERIHSSNHKKDAKGGWWAKRGVDAVTRKKVEGELRAALTSAVPAAAPAPAPVAAALPAVGGLPPMPGVALPDPAYTALVQLIAQNTNSPANPSGRLTDDWVKQVLAHYQVPDANLQNLAHAPQLIAPVADYIAKALAG